MITFNESFYKTSFIYTSGVSAFKEYLLDILNTDNGSRPYYPDYGLLVDKYKYTLLTPALAQQIHADIYFIISSMESCTIFATNYKIKNKKLELYYDIQLGQEPIGLHLTYSDGSFR